ncbi:MAG: permease [Sedimenticolaceae bacterium]
MNSLGATPADGTGGAAASCCAPQPAPNRDTPLLDRLRSVWLLIAAIPLLVLVFDQARVGGLLQIATSELAGTAPFILVAVLLIAYLKAAGAEGLIVRAFAGREKRMIVLAALVGGLAPFCSCQVIPFVAGLLALGVPVSAVMAFWLSSPLIDPASLLVTAGALGWDFAIGKTVAAIFLGLFGGFGIKLALQADAFAAPLRHSADDTCQSGTCGTSSLGDGPPAWRFWAESDRRQIFRRELIGNAMFLFKWLTLAYLLQALLLLYVPAGLIGGIVGGDGLWPVVLGALVGMPAYLNSYAAPPLVAGLMEQGMSAGSAMAFMVAGAISCIPAMTAIWGLVKRQVFAAYLGFGVGGAVIFGAVFGLLVA